MGSDELGPVYEALLEVNATASATARTFELSRTTGNERKTTGSYYTPTSPIARVLDDALDPVVTRAIKDQDGNEATDAILGLTVCDPAMGSAHFLAGAAHRLAKHVASNRSGQTEPSPDDYREALRDVVSRCIYGVDVNPMAVQLAKTEKWSARSLRLQSVVSEPRSQEPHGWPCSEVRFGRVRGRAFLHIISLG